jgi:hypothetical protein
VVLSGGRDSRSVGSKVAGAAAGATAVAQKGGQQFTTHAAAQQCVAQTTALVPASTVQLGKWGEARLAHDLCYQSALSATFITSADE